MLDLYLNDDFPREMLQERKSRLEDLIFPSSIGTPMDPSNLRLDFNRVMNRAGIPKFRFHDLRHTAASLMLNHGIAVIVVSKILGHSKPSITMDIYGHLYNEMQGEASRLMDELVLPVKVSLPTKMLQRTDIHG